MTIKSFKYAIIAMSIGILTFTSCKKDPQPAPEPSQEEYDAARIQYILLNEDGSETRDTLTISFDKTGHPSPHHIHVLADHSYRSLVTLFYNGKSINEEIIEAGLEHQFFFIPSSGNVIEDYDYQDADRNGKGIGLDGIITFSPDEGQSSLKVVLRHGLDKNHAAAQSWKNPNYQEAGGADDLNIEFEIHVVAEGHDHED